MSRHYEIIAVSSPDRLLSEVAINEGVRNKVVMLTRELTLRKDLIALWELFNFFRKEKPLIVHTHTPKAGIVGMVAAWFARVPLRLHTVAGLPLMEATGNKRRLLNWVERMTYICATKVYPNSYGLRDFIVSEKLCKEKKLKVIGNGSSNGIDTSYFNPDLYSIDVKKRLRESLMLNENDFVFIFIGRLVPDKGINELVSSFSNLIKENCKLLLIGPFEKKLYPVLPETELEIENNENIVMVGYQEDVRPYLAISNCLVFPSYREGFPNVVMQAGAMGLPSIVTNINGCNEIIIEGENGIIIPPKDKKALLESMNYCLEHPDEMKRMASNARTLILNRYEQKRMWESILTEYKTLEKELRSRRETCPNGIE